jgi:eukaryotic-like serine/threonine-protein kinase
VIDQARSLGVDGDTVSDAYALAYLHGDDAEIKRLTAENAVRGPGFQSFLLSFDCNWSYSRGQVQTARRLCDQAVQKRPEDKDIVATTRAFQALVESELGNSDEAKKLTQSAKSLSTQRSVQAGVALDLARLGDTNQAEKIAFDLAKQYPKDETLNQASVPVIRASIELQRKQPALALDALQPARAYEHNNGALAPVDRLVFYLAGESYRDQHDWTKAAAEYQQIIDLRGENPESPFHSLARLQLARTFAQRGDTAKAKIAYQDFFAAWKNADADIPVLKQAQAEYAKLQ